MVGDPPKSGVVERGAADGHSLDAVFDLLADPRRRCALERLGEKSQAIALADLAEDVAVSETERPSTEIPEEEIQEIRLRLHHQHLPKLVNAGVVDYDQDHDSIRLSESPARIERVLSIAGDSGDKR